MDISLNVISLFAFLLVIGIIVDDAVIVGENIHLEYERGRTGTDTTQLQELIWYQSQYFLLF